MQSAAGGSEAFAWLERFAIAIIGGALALVGAWQARRVRDNRLAAELSAIRRDVNLANARMLILIELLADLRSAEGTDRRAIDDAFVRFIRAERETKGEAPATDG